MTRRRNGQVGLFRTPETSRQGRVDAKALRYPVHPRANAVEISSGGGLFSLAAEIEGVNVEVHCEINKGAVETLRSNFDASLATCDIRHLSVTPGPEGVDLFMGGPPCQPWSSAASLGAGNLGPDDPRNLWPEMLRLMREIQPRIVLLENVKGILAGKFIPYLGRPDQGIPGTWWQEAEELGYQGTIWTLNAADYGTPQSRERVWMVLWPVGAPWGPALRSPPPQTHYDPRRGRPARASRSMAPWVTARERLQSGCCQGYGLVTCAYLNNLDATCDGCVNGESFRLAHNEEGGGARLDARQSATALGEFAPGVSRLSKSAPFDAGGLVLPSEGTGMVGHYLAPTLTKHMARGPGERIATIEGAAPIDLSCPVDTDAAALRQLSIREAAKLQDVPQWYRFAGSKTSQYEQIGNGIAVNMGRAVIRHALRALRPSAPSPVPGSMAAKQQTRQDYTGLWPYGLGVAGCRSVVPISDERLAEAGYREGRKGRTAARSAFRGGDPNRERRMIDALVSALDELALDDAFVDPDEPEEFSLDEFAHLLPRYTQEGGDYGVPNEDALLAALKRSSSWRPVSSPYGLRWLPA